MTTKIRQHSIRIAVAPLTTDMTNPLANLPFGHTHAANPVNWTNVDGSWQTGANWSTGTVPNANSAVGLTSSAAHAVTYDTATSSIFSLTSTTDSLTIDSGKLTVLNGASFGASLSLIGGQLVLAGAGTLTGAASVSAATLTVSAATTGSGAFTLQNAGTLAIGAAGSVNLSGSVVFDNAYLTGPGVLTTGGANTVLADDGSGNALLLTAKGAWTNTGTVADGGVLYFGNGSGGDTTSGTVTNAGLFNVTSDDAGAVNYGQAPGFKAAFNNTGRFIKTTGTGTNTFTVAINNTGTIAANTGTLAFAAGGTLDGQIGGAGTVALTGGSFAVTGSGNGGAGHLTVNSATLSVTGTQTLSGSLSIVNAGTLAMAAGGAELSSGATQFDNGYLTGPGTLTTSGTTLLADNGSGNDLLISSAGAWANTGTVSDAGQIYLGNGSGGDATSATINNAGLFNVTTDDGGAIDYGQAPGFVSLLNNTGSFIKTGGTGTSTFTVGLRNTGTIAANTGTLAFAAGGTLDGQIGGAGTVALVSGSFVVTGTGNGGAGHLTVNSATLSVTGTQTLSGSLSIVNAGTLAIAAGGSELSSGATQFDNGYLTGPGTLTTSGTTLLADNGSGNDLLISGAGAWTNTGTVSDAGQIYLGNGSGGDATSATINNAGLFNVTADDGGAIDYGQAPGFVSLLDNTGSFIKTGGTGTSSFNLTLASTGTIGATSGTLSFVDGGSLAGVIGASGKTASVLLGAGSFTAGNLALTDNGAAAALTIGDGVTLSAGGTMTLAGKLALAGSASLTNSGLMLLTGADATLSGTGTGYSISNTGIIRDTAGAATASLASTLANSGTVDVAAGILKLSNVTGTGLLKIEAGTTLDIGTNVATTQSLAFGGGLGATLKQDKPASVTTAIANLAAATQIDLAGVSVTSAKVSGNTLTVVAGSKTYTYLSSVSLASFGTSISSDGNGGSIVGLYRDATDSVAPTTLAFGNLHVGDTATQSVSVTNTALADTYSEELDAHFAGLPTGFTATGAIAGLVAGTTGMIGVKLSNATAGAISSSGTLALFSDGTGIDNHTTTALANQVITITGGVYRLASATVATGPVNLGIVHVGDTATQVLAIANGATNDGFSEALDASLSGGGGVTGSGSIADLLAGKSDTTSLTLGILTTASGVISGSATLSLVSDGTTIDGLGTTTLGASTITVTGTVDNYALAAFDDPGGPAITAGGANNFILNLGTLNLNDPNDIVTIGALNAATGLADTLDGTLSVSNGAGFINAGFGTFTGLGAGQDDHTQSVTLTTGTAGMFSETVTLTAHGTNTGGFVGVTQTETLTIIGTVAANGGTYTLVQGPNTIVGAAGVDVFIAAAGALNSRDSLTGSTGFNNVLQLTGAGVFDVNAPKTFANIGTILASEGQAAQGTAPDTRQTLLLRDGTSETVTVASGTGAGGNSNPETITIYGGANTDTINLGAGADSVVVGGAGEIVNGGGGADSFFTSSAYAGATLNGGTGKTTLHITGGGSFAMGSSVTNIAKLALDAAPTAYTLTANTIAGLAITASGAADTITLGAASQTVNANGGAVHVLATAAVAKAAITGATGSVLEITNAGTVVLNAADSNLIVKLDAAGTLTLNKASFISAIGSGSADKITAGAAGQTLTGGAGADTLIGAAAFGDMFLDSSAGLNGDSITMFGGSDIIDVSDLNFASLTESYSGNANKGTLTLADGTHNLAITMVGNYTNANFSFTADPHTGTSIGFH